MKRLFVCATLLLFTIAYAQDAQEAEPDRGELIGKIYIDAKTWPYFEEWLKDEGDKVRNDPYPPDAVKQLTHIFPGAPITQETPEEITMTIYNFGLSPELVQRFVNNRLVDFPDHIKRVKRYSATWNLLIQERWNELKEAKSKYQELNDAHEKASQEITDMTALFSLEDQKDQLKTYELTAMDLALSISEAEARLAAINTRLEGERQTAAQAGYEEQLQIAKQMLDQQEQELQRIKKAQESGVETLAAVREAEQDILQTKQAVSSFSAVLNELQSPTEVRLREMLVEVETDLAGLKAKQTTLEKQRAEVRSIVDLLQTLISDNNELSRTLIHYERILGNERNHLDPAPPVREPVVEWTYLLEEDRQGSTD